MGATVCICANVLATRWAVTFGMVYFLTQKLKFSKLLWSRARERVRIRATFKWWIILNLNRFSFVFINSLATIFLFASLFCFSFSSRVVFVCVFDAPFSRLFYFIYLFLHANGIFREFRWNSVTIEIRYVVSHNGPIQHSTRIQSTALDTLDPLFSITNFHWSERIFELREESTEAKTDLLFPYRFEFYSNAYCGNVFVRA